MVNATTDPPLVHLLTQVERQLSAGLGAYLEQEGVSLDQWRVLSLLADGAGHPMSEVAAYAMVPAPTLTKLVDRLVAANLVHRRVDPGDRRRVLVGLTARGRALNRRLSALVQQHEERVADLLGEEAEELRRLLEALAAVPDASRTEVR